jgi:hypothetical protein
MDTPPQETGVGAIQTVVFVCLHGSRKSLLAAEHSR